MDEARRALLAELQELWLESAVERLLETGVLDAGTLETYRDAQLRVWCGRSLAELGNELDALHRHARRQRRREPARSRAPPRDEVSEQAARRSGVGRPSGLRGARSRPAGRPARARP